MKSLTNRLFILILWMTIAMIPLSCGSRKAITKINKNAEITKEETKSKGEVNKVEEKKEVEKQVAKTKKEDENKTVIVTELFNDEGVIKSRIKEVNINKATNTSSNSKESLKSYYINTDSVFNNTIYRTQKITTTIKDKASTTNRNGLYWYLGVCTIIGLAFWLKPWKK